MPRSDSTEAAKTKVAPLCATPQSLPLDITKVASQSSQTWQLENGEDLEEDDVDFLSSSDAEGAEDPFNYWRDRQHEAHIRQQEVLLRQREVAMRHEKVSLRQGEIANRQEAEEARLQQRVPPYKEESDRKEEAMIREQEALMRQEEATCRQHEVFLRQQRALDDQKEALFEQLSRGQGREKSKRKRDDLHDVTVSTDPKRQRF